MIDTVGPIVTEYYGGTEGGFIACISAEEWLVDFNSAPRGVARSGQSLDPIDEQLRQFDFLDRRHRERRSAAQSRGDRGDHVGIGVSVNQRRVVIEEVDASLAIGIGQVLAVSGSGIRRVWRLVERCARVAAGHHGTGAREQARSFRIGRSVGIGSGDHRGHGRLLNLPVGDVRANLREVTGIVPKRGGE